MEITFEPKTVSKKMFINTPFGTIQLKKGMAYAEIENGIVLLKNIGGTYDKSRRISNNDRSTVSRKKVSDTESFGN